MAPMPTTGGCLLLAVKAPTVGCFARHMLVVRAPAARCAVGEVGGRGSHLLSGVAATGHAGVGIVLGGARVASWPSTFVAHAIRFDEDGGGEGDEAKYTVEEVVEILAKDTLSMVEGLRLPRGCAPREFLAASLELSNLRDGCRALVEQVSRGGVTEEGLVNLLLGLHSKIRVLLMNFGHRDEDGLSIPLVIPPGGQVDVEMFDRCGLNIFRLPTSWVDKGTLTSLVFSMYVTQNAVGQYKKVQGAGSEDDGVAPDEE